MKNISATLIGGLVLGASSMLIGCGGGHHGNAVVIYYADGYYGYYSGAVFCDYANDYCGTGNNYGIANNGTSYNGYNNGAGVNNGTNTGNNGSNTGNNGGSSNGGGNGTSTGSNGSNTGNNGGSSNGGGNGTSTGSSLASAAKTASGVAACTDVASCVSQASTNDFLGASSLASGSAAGLANSTASDVNESKDSDLQKSAVEQSDLNDRADFVSQMFGMSVDSARQLVTIAAKVDALSAQGEISAKDRQAITRATLGVAGISETDVNSAMSSYEKSGDQKAINSLMEKAAQNLGMSSSAGLKDQILPTLGITLTK